MTSQRVLFITLAILLSAHLFSQSLNTDSAYNVSMNLYKAGKFGDAANAFNKIYDVKKFGLSSSYLYDGACIYALNGNSEKAFEIIDYLVTVKSYANYKHITTDSDLKSLYVFPKWKELTVKVKENAQRAEERIKGRIKPE